MQTKPPSLLPILRTANQAALLMAMMVGPHDGESIGELADHLGIDPSTVLREVDRLEAAGVVTTTRVGRTRLVSINLESPFTPPLRELILAAFGPEALITEALSSIDGIDQALIFGSWAALERRQPVGAPGDIDVMVVGHPNREAVYTALGNVEAKIDRSIDVTIRTPEQWENLEDPFVATVRNRPIIRLKTGAR